MLLLKIGYVHSAHLPCCCRCCAPIFHRGLCCVTHAWVHLNAKLHKINKHCTAPTSLITNPCFLFCFFILTTKLYKARWQLTPFDKISLIWFGSRTRREEAADCSAGGDCQPCHQAVGSVEAALLTGRAAESRGVALVRQSPPLEVFFSPLGSTGKHLRSYIQQWPSACKNECRRKPE